MHPFPRVFSPLRATRTCVSAGGVSMLMNVARGSISVKALSAVSSVLVLCWFGAESAY